MILTLATIDEAGHPAARSMVCRELADDGSLWFTCDRRSVKVEHLQRDPRTACLLWLAPLRLQFRFEGTMQVIETPAQPERRQQIWAGMPLETRGVFYGPQPGSLRVADPILPREIVHNAPVPDTFALLVLQPTTVERLSVATQPHERTRWRLESAWQAQQLNP